MAKSPISELDKMQRMDHDTLIRLETKVDTMVSDIKELKDGTALKIADHETRLRAMEKIVEITTPEQSIKQLQELIQWKSNFQFTWRVLVGVASIVGALVGFLLNFLFDFLGWFNK